MNLRHPSANRIKSEPGMETIPSFSEGSTKGGVSPRKSAQTATTDERVWLGRRTSGLSVSRKHLNPAFLNAGR